ncbi:hypothetical protein KEM56_001333, partial [Ascosphaera pollenicola]
NDNREWPGTVEIYTNGNAKNETVAKVWLNHTDTQSSTGKKRRNKKGNKKKPSAQSLRGLRSEFANLSTGKDMGNGASKEMANGRTQHVPPQTSAPSGRPHLTTRSLEPPKYNINSTPHSEILALLTRYFTKELKPCMDDYIAAPPTAAKQRDAEYLILNERCERDIVLQLDALVCDGDQDMRAKRKSLTNAVHQELKLLDDAVIAAGGIHVREKDNSKPYYLLPCAARGRDTRSQSNQQSLLQEDLKRRTASEDIRTERAFAQPTRYQGFK